MTADIRRGRRISQPPACMLEEEKSGEAQKSGREKQPRALLAPCTFEISRPEQHSVMKMKSVEVGGAPGMEFDVDVDVEVKSQVRIPRESFVFI